MFKRVFGKIFERIFEKISIKIYILKNKLKTLDKTLAKLEEETGKKLILTCISEILNQNDEVVGERYVVNDGERDMYVLYAVLCKGEKYVDFIDAY